jgi:hypothetical protein
MPETQAKSGATGSSATPDEAAGKNAAPNGREAAAARGAAPAEAASPPKFTRAPGMAPPPGDPNGDGDDTKRPGGIVKGSASVPTVTKGKGAAPGSTSGRVSVPGAAKPGGPGNSTGPQQRPAGAATAPAPGQTTSGKARPAGPQQQQPQGGNAAVGAARVTEAVRSARTTVTSAAARGPRRARLNLKRIDPWSVMKFSFAVSIVLFIVVVVATSVLYLALDAMGVWGEVNTSLKELVNASGGDDASSTGGFQITAWGVIGTSMLIGAVNVVLFTALATLGAFIYNVCADLVGGVELTLAERD